MADSEWKSLRCTVCLTNWPNEPTCDPCPECGESVRGSNNEPAEDAASRRLHAEFERFCEKRDALRQREIDRLERALTGEIVTQTGLPRPRGRLSPP